MNVVFDCMVFLQAAGRPDGPAFACFDHVQKLGATLWVSPAVLLEIGEVLHRPKIRKRFPRLTDWAVVEFLRQVELRSKRIEIVPEVSFYPRDPKDQPYLNLAIACNAEYLVTRDRDLLDLADPASDFLKRLPQVRILLPEQFLTVTADKTGVTE